MTGSPSPTFKAGQADGLLVEPLDQMTLIYQRRSGITHIVAEPIPEILTVMGDEFLSAEDVAARLANSFELDASDAIAIVSARLEELAALGLLERRHA